MTHHVNNTIMKIDYERVIQQKEIMVDYLKETIEIRTIISIKC